MEQEIEKVFYQNADVKVTQSRFVSGEKTYAMRNVSSVSTFRHKRSYLFEVILISIGLAFIASPENWAIGLVVLAIAGLMIILIKRKYSVRINSNSGETDGFISTNREIVDRIVASVNEAMIFRG